MCSHQQPIRHKLYWWPYHWRATTNTNVCPTPTTNQARQLLCTRLTPILPCPKPFHSEKEPKLQHGVNQKSRSKSYGSWTPSPSKKPASTWLCWLCTAECMTIGHNFISTNRRSKIINLESKMRGVCSCKTRFLWFSQSDKEGGLWWRQMPKNRAGELICMDGCIFLEGS